ncbi:MAG: AraC-like DNA-binding protein [Halioglobus sp.]|jgi:AraC-like DNA-binding protein
MHSYYISTLLQVLDSQDISRAQLLHNTGFEDSDPLTPLSLTAAQLDIACSNALEFSGDTQLGLKFGSQISIASQGIFGYALMTSATIGDALKLLVRYNRVILPSIGIELQQHETELELWVNAAHLPLTLQRFYTEVLYAAIINSGSMLLGRQTAIIKLHLGYTAPADVTLYHSIFGTDLLFSCPRSSMFFDHASLIASISTSNPVARDIFRRECDRLVSRGGQGGIVSGRVQQVLLQAGSEFPTSTNVAQQLHMSESTLQRNLAKEGSKFQQLLDDVRYRLAKEYLWGTDLPVAEIASLLGFSDAANFRKSFKRWCGSTPSQTRKLGVTTPEVQSTH